MSKRTNKIRDANGRAGYKSSLRTLQIEFVKVQKHIIKHGHKVLVIFEGRDASGKDGTITISGSSNISVHARPVSLPSASLPTRIAPPGTSSALSRICPHRRNWSSSIAVGTIAPALNG
jgi:hypothetical protein